MTKGGRIAAGIISVIGSGIYLFSALIIYDTYKTTGVGLALLMVVAAIGVIGLIGAIMLLRDKTKGAYLILIVGLISLIVQIYLVFQIVTGPPYFLAWIFFIPPAIFLIFGLVGLAVGSEL